MVTSDKSSLRPVEGAGRRGRDRLNIRGELMLALLPTLTILVVLWTVETLAEQRVLFAALASSAFLIYLDPEHGTNTLRSLSVSHITAALAGMGTGWLLGYGYGASGLAMVLTILVMVLADVVHPPAIGTSLTFAYRSGAASNATLFLLALGMVVLLSVLQRGLQYLFAWLLARSDQARETLT